MLCPGFSPCSAGFIDMPEVRLHIKVHALLKVDGKQGEDERTREKAEPMENTLPSDLLSSQLPSCRKFLPPFNSAAQ